MKKLFEYLLFSVFCLALLFLLRWAYGLLEEHLGVTSNTPYYALVSGLIVFWVAGITYGWLWSLKKPRKRSGAAALLFPLGWILLFALIPILQKSRAFHAQVFSDHIRGVRGLAHQADDSLGLVAIPGAGYEETYRYGDPLLIRYDARGFRIPVSGDSLCKAGQAADLLFLGCSFTFGASVLAEESFPYLAAHQTGKRYLNAGLGSYGLAHMLILARRLIPEYRPAYVIIQYSPWLVARGTSLYGPSFLGRLPFPYFTAVEDSFTLAPPAFRSQLFSVDKQALRDKYRSRKWAFYTREAIPFFIRDHWMDLKTRASVIFGSRPAPANELAEVEHHAYREIVRIARQAGSKPLVLLLGDSLYSRQAAERLGRDLTYIHADSLIMRHIADSQSGDFDQEYYIWRLDGKRPVMVDRHPNPRIHRVIARSIINHIN